MPGFEVVCEIQPPTTADMGIVREQIAVLRRSCHAFLIPDSHLGRATISSVAVAHEVAYLQSRAIACLNARDRNLLGLQRDLLTATAYGVDELLFVYGDPPSGGERSALTVRDMLREVRGAGPGFRVGVAADITRDLPEWKHQADFVFTQIAFDPGAVARWCERTGFEGAVFAGVVVLASEKMARRLTDVIPGLEIPDRALDGLASDPDAGVDIALHQVLELRDSGAVDGVHLIPARRFRQTAAALERAGL
jgi:methylenetetrahydrofolate reductase (NADPH)